MLNYNIINYDVILSIISKVHVKKKKKSQKYKWIGIYKFNHLLNILIVLLPSRAGLNSFLICET
jgi:hypothetical protein